MPDRNMLVDAMAYGLGLFLLSLLFFAACVAARVVKRADAGDRRRHILAGTAVFASPIFFAGLAQSLIWLCWRSWSSMSDLGEVALFFLNLLAAAICSAAAAFLPPFRSSRERGAAIVGGAVTAFAIFCIAASMLGAAVGS